MAKVYSDEDKEAVYSLLCEGYGVADIMRKAAAGEWSRPYPLEIPRSSVKNIRQAMVAKHGPPTPNVSVEGEKDAVSASRRRLARVLIEQERKLTTLGAKARVLEPNELKMAIQLEDALARIEKRAQEPAPDGKSPKHKKAEQTKKNDSDRSLAAMVRAAQEQAQEPASATTPSLAEAEADSSTANGSGPVLVPASGPASGPASSPA